MRIAIMGAGGQGCFFGACLAGNGNNDVTLIARGTNLEAIRKRGIRVRSKELGDISSRVPATDKPEDVGQVDVILFCVKTYDLDLAARQIRPLVGPATLIIPVQNGVDAAERIGSIVGMEHLLGAISWVNASAEAPGVIVHGGSTRLIFGDLSGMESHQANRILQVLHEAGLRAAELHPSIRDAIWEKFVSVAAINGVFALTRLPAGPLRDCPETWELLRKAMEEDAAVARAKGVSIHPGYVAKTLDLLGGYAPWSRPSMLVDVEAGRRLELEAMTGTVVRLGRELGVETPISSTIYMALKPYENGPPRMPTAP